MFCIPSLLSLHGLLCTCDCNVFPFRIALLPQTLPAFIPSVCTLFNLLASFISLFWFMYLSIYSFYLFMSIIFWSEPVHSVVVTAVEFHCLLCYFIIYVVNLPCRVCQLLIIIPPLSVFPVLQLFSVSVFLVYNIFRWPTGTDTNLKNELSVNFQPTCREPCSPLVFPACDVGLQASRVEGDASTTALVYK